MKIVYPQTASFVTTIISDVPSPLISNRNGRCVVENCGKATIVTTRPDVLDKIAMLSCPANRIGLSGL